KSKRLGREKGQIGFWARVARNPAAEDLADDFASYIRCERDFAVDDSISCVRGWIFRGLSRWRRRLHPDAVDGLRARDSHSPGGWHRFVRDHHLSKLR